VLSWAFGWGRPRGLGARRGLAVAVFGAVLGGWGFAVAAADATRTAAHAAAGVSGSGTDDRLYVAPCDTPSPFTDCTVAFPERSLSGLWANERVPAYRCPTDHPFLLNQNYAPAGTLLPRGVEVSGLGPIGVSIADRAVSHVDPLYDPTHTWAWYFATGTVTGVGNTATNWTLGTASYRVILHCTYVTDSGLEGLVAPVCRSPRHEWVSKRARMRGDRENGIRLRP